MGKIWKYTEEAKDAEGLYELNEQLNLNASLTLLANIGENVSKLTDALKMEYSKEKIFDVEKIKVSKESNYYKYIDF